MSEKLVSRRAALLAGAAAGASALAAPAIAQQSPRVLRMATSWPGGLSGLADSVARVASAITEGSGGALRVDVYPAGTLVPPLGVHDAVGAGEVELYHSVDYYYQKKHRGLNFFSTVPMGLTAMELIAWINHGGGQALWDEVNARFGVKAMAVGGTGTQMGGWFVEPINSVDDLKKTIMRIPGLGGQVLNALGVETVVLPGGGIVAALTNGEIGATEWVGPWNDLQFGFQKLLGTYMYPGFHEPGTTASLGINLALWNELSPREQALIETTAQSEALLHTSHYLTNNAISLRSLEQEYGIQPQRIPDEVIDVIARKSEEVVAGVANDDELAKRIYDSYSAFRTAVINDSATQGEFAFQMARAQVLSR
ncbi:MAG: TRAP transporter substrate-binding protein [Pseudomonadota bacterium]